MEKETTEEVCDLCDGTWIVPDLIFEENSKEWIVDGVRKCLCAINKQIEE
jgi:hypothetical protein